MASRDALVLGLIAAGGLGAYVISQRGQDGEAAEPETVEAGYIDPVTGLPGVASDVWGATGFQEPGDAGYIEPGSPDDPYFMLAQDQGEEALAIQRDGERSRTRAAWTETAIIGGVGGIVAGGALARAVGAWRASQATGALGRSTGPLKASGPWLPETASKASQAAPKASQAASRGTSVFQRASTATRAAASRTASTASAVARSPVTRTVGRVAGRVATPLIAAETAVRALQTGSALARGNRQQAAQRAGQTVGAGTAALSLGAVRITPKAPGKTNVRVGNQRVTVNAPNSVREAGRNVRRNFRTAGRKFRRLF